ncbi:transmembrane protein 150A-like [Polyodon spathula]|uniref:transmembrane protein 150A-like n=1 Tax=Polyodon spathula TaxID=7913 RepID=UPI001B7F0C94|nr:transmembrane protein 150A-like [Polyodon spathula]XP_041117835.1 transmembrane protein 150A-like [Polyodon spathula]
MNFWFLLPAVLSLISFFGTWTVYGLALANHHVCPLDNWQYTNSCSPNSTERCCMIQHIPFISTCGMHAPENALFSATLNSGAILLLVFCIFQHAHIIKKNSDNVTLSRIGLAVGCLSSFGAFITGNCNPGTLMVLHYVGAALCFVSTCLYTLIMSILTYRCFITGLEYILAPIRTISTTIQITATIFYTVFFPQETYDYQHISAIFEWVLATNIQLFELSFVVEFYYFSTSMLSVLMTKDEEETSLIMS